MSAPSSGPGGSRAALADGRGLTAAGAVAVALVLGLAGATIDLMSGSGLREVFAVSFVTGCLVAALTVHREDLFAVVVMPPLVYVAVALVAGVIETSGNPGSFLTRQAIELINSVVIGAPILMVATAAALVVALVRWTAARR